MHLNLPNAVNGIRVNGIPLQGLQEWIGPFKNGWMCSGSEWDVKGEAKHPNDCFETGI